MPNSVLVKIRTSFVEELTSLPSLLDRLVEEEIINKDDYQNIDSTSGLANKKRKLLDILDEKRWIKIKDKLISALLETDNEFIVEKINEQEGGKVVSHTLATPAQQNMSAAPEAKIIRNFGYLTQNLSNIPSVLNQLIENLIIELNDRVIIMSKVGNEQATALFELLIKKDMDIHLSTVLRILRNTGNPHLAAKIEST